MPTAAHRPTVRGCGYRTSEGRDWLLVVVLALLAVWEVPRRVDEGGDPWWRIVLTVAVLAPVPWLRTAPLAALALTATAFAAYPLRDGSPELLVHALALLSALYVTASTTERTPALVVPAIGIVAGLVRSTSMPE